MERYYSFGLIISSLFVLLGIQTGYLLVTALRTDSIGSLTVDLWGTELGRAIGCDAVLGRLFGMMFVIGRERHVPWWRVWLLSVSIGVMGSPVVVFYACWRILREAEWNAERALCPGDVVSHDGVTAPLLPVERGQGHLKKDSQRQTASLPRRRSTNLLILAFWFLAVVLLLFLTVWAMRRYTWSNSMRFIHQHRFVLATFHDVLVGLTFAGTLISVREDRNWKALVGWYLGLLLLGNITTGIYSIVTCIDAVQRNEPFFRILASKKLRGF